MQLFFSEFTPDYSNYTFPYQIYLRLESGDDLSRIYFSGFIPMRSQAGIFYLARSSRVKLSQFELSSENRRILRKVDYLTYQITPVEDFQYTKEVQKFCLDSSKSIGKGKPIIPVSAIRTMFTGQANVTHVLVFKNIETNQVQGYVGLVVHGTFVHYAHPFPSSGSSDPNLNIGMMTLAVDWAYKQHKQFIYIGTVATAGLMYKSQFKGFEFFVGNGWSSNLDELKFIVNRTSETHLWDDESYISKFQTDTSLTATLTPPFRARMK